MDMIDRLLGHDDWGTTTLLELSRSLTDAQLDQEFDIGHRTLRATFDHMIYNVAFWSGLMTGHPFEEQRSKRTLAELINRHQRFHATFAALTRQLRDEQRLDDVYVDHYDARKSMGGTIIHVVLHNAEHRTEALHILERLGLNEVPEVDFGLWDYLQHNE